MREPFGDAMARDHAHTVACKATDRIFASREKTDRWLRKGKNPTSYLYRCAVNGKNDFWRSTEGERENIQRPAKTDRAERDMLGSVVDATAPSAEVEFLRREREALLTARFGKDRAALLLGEITQIEYARLTGVSESTVSRMMEKLRPEAALLLKLSA
jgi:DNA-directed RNA polymerase specialized sigma24 family protein